MPGAQLVDVDAVIQRQGRIDLALGRGERLAREGVQIVEQLEHFLLALLVQRKLHGVIIGKAELARRLVPQQDELPQVGFHRAADLLAGFPHALPLARVFGFLERLAHRAIDELLVPDLGTKDVERLFDFVRRGRDPLQ